MGTDTVGDCPSGRGADLPFAASRSGSKVGVIAQTRFSPDLAAAGDRMMAWSGAGVLGLIGLMVLRGLRRMAGAR